VENIGYPPHPSITSILQWLRQNGVACNLVTPDRPLRACLVAREGYGLVFIDGTDSESEQRFSLAHELAHFLHDYLFPRGRVLRNLGRAALEVLDGHRPPTAEERIHALLSSTTIGFHAHFMDREPIDRSRPGAIADAENCADRLAFELLAPAEHVVSSISSASRPPSLEEIAGKLRESYGLPDRQAAEYAAKLAAPKARTDPLLLALKEAS
jgi:IrrE N-terminal-like domain